LVYETKNCILWLSLFMRGSGNRKCILHRPRWQLMFNIIWYLNVPEKYSNIGLKLNIEYFVLIMCLKFKFCYTPLPKQHNYIMWIRLAKSKQIWVKSNNRISVFSKPNFQFGSWIRYIKFISKMYCKDAITFISKSNNYFECPWKFRNMYSLAKKMNHFIQYFHLLFPKSFD
jgi:hypothetical protein